MKNIVQIIIALLFVTELHAQEKLSLENALRIARENNPELRQRSLEIDKVLQERVIARSLFLPSVYAGAQANHYFQRPVFFGFGENNEEGRIPYGRLGGEDQLGASVTAVQPLYNPIAYPSYAHAELRQKEAALAARDKEIEVLSNIQDTYLRILVLQERIRLAEESIQRNQKVLQDSRLLFIQGKGLRVDTLRAYTSVKNLEPDLVRLTYAIETGKLQLRALMGVDSLTDFKLTDSLTIPFPENTRTEETIYEEVVASNPSFQVLKVRTQLAKQQVRLASAYRKPVVSLVAQYRVQTQTDDLEYGNAHYPSTSFVGLQLSVPLFTGLRAQATAKHAEFSRQQSELDVAYTQQRLREQVHQAIANNKEALLRLENTAIVQETAQLSYDIIQYRYKNGISPRLELTDAELALSTAQSNYLEAVYDYLSARIELRRLGATSP